MNERLHFFIVLVCAVLSTVVTAVICYLAVVTDAGSEKSLLLGALLGSPSFAGVALFALLGIRRQPAQAGPTTNVETTGAVSVDANAAPAQP